jgi:CheY-like chemotaxis protein
MIGTKQVPTLNHGTEKLFEGFENLMPFRVQDILLVSSLYDSFILREDGRLNELLMKESLDLHLQNVPGISHVASGSEALELVRSEPRFNLIVTNLQVGDMNAAELAAQVNAAGMDVPVLVLAYDYREIKDFMARRPRTDIERIFLWQGNGRILISMVKYIEDKRNVQHDAEAMSVPVVLLVEDNIRYYSAFLPVLYTEIWTQTRRLIDEGINLQHKLLRMRARPKILLCSTYEEAEEQTLRYRDHLLGVILDVEFPRDGKVRSEIGFDLAETIRDVVPDVPIVLQSSRAEYMTRAHRQRFSFVQKNSPTLLGDLQRFLTEHVGFGDFVFRRPDQTEVGRASDLNQLEHLLHTVPSESVAYHAERNHFSHWFMTRTEFALAQKLRPRKVSDYTSVEELRKSIIDSIGEYRYEQGQTHIGDFTPASFSPEHTFFLRIGGGSLGGKARGLAFVRSLLHRNRLTHRFANIRISVPPTLVLATDIFDRFVADNDLLEFAMNCADDEQIATRFVAARLPTDLIDSLLAFLEKMHCPLAVRSSSLLEDSQYQPFSGVYETYMLPNQDADLQARLEQLMEAIKRVYASTFSRHAKAYVRATPYRLEEEKMAVVIQQVVGDRYGDRYYPDFSGVVRSRNFYPVPPVTMRDGFAAVALGLGRAVVGGGQCLTFSPRYPRNLVQFSSVEDILANSQTEFWALSMNRAERCANSEDALREVPYPISLAEEDGRLGLLASTYSADNHAIYDGLSRKGTRVVSFAPILKYGMYPLPAILDQLMTIGEAGLGRPVEIEFAVRLSKKDGETSEFGFLQMRPLVVSREGEDLRIEAVEREKLVCQTSQILGHGRIDSLHDVVVVDFHRFERARSHEVAQSVAIFNSKLSSSGTPYLLIGVGRWGSNEPWLGIPVAWDQISGARAIVESGFRDFRVLPSQGSHFFQNLTAFQIGYFTVNPDAGEGFIDWGWLSAQPALQEDGCVRHLRFSSPLSVIMNGKTSEGLILKPEGS